MAIDESMPIVQERFWGAVVVALEEAMFVMHAVHAERRVHEDEDDDDDENDGDEQTTVSIVEES